MDGGSVELVMLNFDFANNIKKGSDMKSIDLKSLLIGILGTALVMVLMGQSRMQKQYDIECVLRGDDSVSCVRYDLNKGVWDAYKENGVTPTWSLHNWKSM